MPRITRSSRKASSARALDLPVTPVAKPRSRSRSKSAPKKSPAPVPSKRSSSKKRPCVASVIDKKDRLNPFLTDPTYTAVSVNSPKDKKDAKLMKAKKLMNNKDDHTQKDISPSILPKLFLLPLLPILFLLLLRIPLHFTSPPPPAPYIPSLPTTFSSSLPPTLSSFLQLEPYHAYAPVFFGFYSYFGFLSQLPPTTPAGCAGASAGAMAASLACAGASPEEIYKTADKVASLQFGDVADVHPFPFPFRYGFMAGNKFVSMFDGHLSTLLSLATPPTFLDTPSPLGLTVYDVLLTGALSMSPATTPHASVSQAVRASATFPFLFSPAVYWPEGQWLPMLLLDGGIGDVHGVEGEGGEEREGCNATCKATCRKRRGSLRERRLLAVGVLGS